MEVDVSRSADVLCVSWSASEAINADAYYRLDLRQANRTNSGALVAIFANAGGQVKLGYPGADERADRGIVRGAVTTRGSRITLRLDRKLLPAWAPWQHFEWEASSLGFPADQRPNLQYFDCMPNGGNHIDYPSGQAVAVDQPLC